MTLDAIGPDLRLAEGPIVSFYGFAYPTRMVIARLPDGGAALPFVRPTIAAR